jgi:molybdopterin converting factor subunit 1
MTIKIKLRFFALYREVVGRGQMEMEVKEGTTPAYIWHELCQEFPKLAEQSDTWKVAVNNEYADPGVNLREGDEVAFIPPLSGG